MNTGADVKVRSGFVSNSSSSSFTIICKDSLDRQRLLEVIGVPDKHPLKELSDSIVECILRCANPIDEEELRQDVKEYQCEDHIRNLKAIEDGLYVYEGSFGDDDYSSIEAFLCRHGLNINTEGIKIECRGGY